MNSTSYRFTQSALAAPENLIYPDFPVYKHDLPEFVQQIGYAGTAMEVIQLNPGVHIDGQKMVKVYIKILRSLFFSWETKQTTKWKLEYLTFAEKLPFKPNEKVKKCWEEIKKITGKPDLNTSPGKYEEIPAFNYGKQSETSAVIAVADARSVAEDAESDEDETDDEDAIAGAISGAGVVAIAEALSFSESDDDETDDEDTVAGTGPVTETLSGADCDAVSGNDEDETDDDGAAAEDAKRFVACLLGGGLEAVVAAEQLAGHWDLPEGMWLGAAISFPVHEGRAIAVLRDILPDISDWNEWQWSVVKELVSSGAIGAFRLLPSCIKGYRRALCASKLIAFTPRGGSLT